MEEPVVESIQEAATHAVEETAVKYLDGFVSFIKSFLTWDNLFKVIGALVIIAIMTLILKLIKRSIKRIPEAKLAKHNSTMICKFINYIFYILIVMYVLSLFGVKLTAIWGAAGIAGVAIGFAAQTSISNLISGLFVLGERTMKVGDVIVVNGITGTVDSISLLSVKVHTVDNQLIRIPNSTIINSNFANNSYFATRRLTVNVSVDYSTDLNKAISVLKTVPDKCPSVLKDPAFTVGYESFGESGINMFLAVWFKNGELIQTRTDVCIAIKEAFNEAGINIPFNRLDVSMIS